MFESKLPLFGWPNCPYKSNIIQPSNLLFLNFQNSKGVAREIEQLQNRFLWGGKSDSKHIL